MKTITAKELKSILDGHTEGDGLAFIDVRYPHEFLRMRIPGFTNISFDDMEKRAGEFKDKDRVYLICQIGDNSGNMGRHLEKLGYKAAFTNIRGGLLAWIDEGYVIDASDEDGNPTLSKMRDTIDVLLRKLK